MTSKRIFYPVPSLCECGCNNITWNGKLYIHGHNQRNKRTLSSNKLYWTEKNIINELYKIIKQIGHFPTHNELIHMEKWGIYNALKHKGNIHKFREILGYNQLQYPNNYWTEDKIINELEKLTKELGTFPTTTYIAEHKLWGLYEATHKFGGINKYRNILNTSILRKEWNEGEVINKLNSIHSELGYFPTYTEIMNPKYQGLRHAINRFGGISKFRSLCGITQGEFESYIGSLSSYIHGKERKTEDLVYKILISYCEQMNISQVIRNNKLNTGNNIEFVCNNNKKIGIDVTNTRSIFAVTRKYTKKDYCKYLDELWIVVFSDVFTEKDYIRWNKKSPDNVYVMSIEEFCNELQYDLDINLKEKIEKYKKCSFHTRNKLKGEQ